MLIQYYDLLADVRKSGKYVSVRSLVTPDNEEVRELAMILRQASDFITAAQDFVASFTSYQREVGDFWARPAETLWAQTLRREYGIKARCDCDDMAILLCSILRAGGVASEDVYCAVGFLGRDGHMWNVMDSGDYYDRVLEATAPSSAPVRGNYRLYTIFNDQYTFSTEEGIKIFDFKPVVEKEAIAA